ncbi:hypothetical protein HDU81_008158 [Chytriomyces hyalinus]|nr:hypothetical protein HDU81_008158 [Chytriomyces hyalinus]
MNHQTERTVASNEQGVTPGTASALSMPPVEANAATPQNDKNAIYTRLHHIPPEVIIQIFAWVPGPTVLIYRRLSKTINECLMTKHFALLNLQITDFRKTLSIPAIQRLWIHFPAAYQTVVASTLSRLLKCIGHDFDCVHENRLPKTIACLPAVKRIDLRGCNLIGEIPDEIGALRNLTYMNLQDNSLAGMLPSSFNLLRGLRELNLSNNQLSGEFPALPKLNALETLRIDRNRFTGAIPTIFGKPHMLTLLHASCNLFNILPASIRKLSNLASLKISGNAFTCEIPPEIWNLTQLRHLEMVGCDMFGSIAGVVALQNLETLLVSHNRFSGDLPTHEFRNLRSLEQLHLSRNQFSQAQELGMRAMGLLMGCVDSVLYREGWCFCWGALEEFSGQGTRV